MSRDSSEPPFAADVEFRKLLARRNDVDVVTAALELARDGERQLDFGPTHRWIEQRADELAGDAASASPECCVELLAECLGDRHDLRGDADSYRRAESSYLSHVVETRRGIPVSLSLLYVAVGRRLGLEMYGVSAPARFLVGCETPRGRSYVDAFAGGRIRNEDETVSWLAERTGLPLDRLRRTLRPAEPRTVVIRMLSNLKRLFVERQEWGPALRVQRRLTALQPAEFEQRRELAVLSFRAARWAEAIDLLERCLRSCPVEERPELRAHLRRARSQIAGWN
ncbi:MAG: SirB1 family protein [Planctomycetaceae bacterium]